MKNTLILVLSSRREPWGDIMDASLRTWDAPHPHTMTRYYCAHPDRNRLEHERVRYSHMPDSLEAITPRTLEAFGWALEEPDWDYLARPNTPCYVHKPNLVAHVQTLPETHVLRGLWTGDFLWGGGQFIFSRDVIQGFVDTGDKWANNLMDDQAITKAAQALGIDTQQGGSACSVDDNRDGTYTLMSYGLMDSFPFTDFSETRRAVDAGHYFFRLKTDHDRTQDVRIMEELHRVFTA